MINQVNFKTKRSIRRYLTKKKIDKNTSLSIKHIIHLVEVEGEIPYILSSNPLFRKKYIMFFNYKGRFKYKLNLLYPITLDTEDINILKKIYYPLEGRGALASAYYKKCSDCKQPHQKNRMCDWCQKKSKFKELYSYINGESDLLEMGINNNIRKWNRRNAWSGKL